MFHSDAAFVIGKTHAVCQDYALAADTGAFSAAWLSDGCSSSPHTDLGARLLPHLTLTQTAAGLAAIGQDEAPPSASDAFIRDRVMQARHIVGEMGVTQECLNATLLGLAADKDRGVLFAFLYGDGAVVYGMDDGTRIILHSSYPAHFPEYPAYLANPEHRAAWERVSGNQQVLTRTALDAGGSVVTTEALPHDVSNRLVTRQLSGVRWAAILSDGVDSFQARQAGPDSVCSESVSYLDAIHHLTAFKNFAGSFVNRRLNAFTKECARRGWYHNDDISIATIHFGDGGEG